MRNNLANLSPQQRQARRAQEIKARKRNWHPILTMAQELINYASVSDRNPEVRKKRRKQIAQRFWQAFKSWLLKKI